MFWDEVPCCYRLGEKQGTECFDMAVPVFGAV